MPLDRSFASSKLKSFRSSIFFFSLVKNMKRQVSSPPPLGNFSRDLLGMPSAEAMACEAKGLWGPLLMPVR